MLQTIAIAILLIGAVAYIIRHFLKIYRTGSDCGCSGCSSSCCCSGAPHSADHLCIQEHGPPELPAGKRPSAS
jgi:hypothetical protein